MSTVTSDCLKRIQLGDSQNYEHIVVFPLFAADGLGPEYMTMPEALEARLLVIGEVSESGSVPELRVENKADTPVLLLDGEEMIGAKQNRVLNTSILLKEKSVTVIPVSCTEQGRWHYSSEFFLDSDVVMSRKSRARKMDSVTESLGTHHKPQSDQMAVWAGIEELHADAGTCSATGAMRDAYEARQADINKALAAFPLLDGQHGLLVAVNGRVVGFDLLSQPSAYARLHAKILKSYVFDALVERKRKKVEEDLRPKAEAFLSDTDACEAKDYPSTGYGTDWRFKGGGVVGAALVHEETVIHAAFFRIEDSEEAGPMAGYRRRRSHFIR